MSKADVIEIKSVRDFDEIVGNNKHVAIDFTAVWCGPCKVMGPVFKALSADFTDVVFVKVDVDQLSELAQRFEIHAMPTFKFLRDGDVVDEIVGANKTKLKDSLTALTTAAAESDDAPAVDAAPADDAPAVDAAPADDAPAVDAAPADEAAPAA
ncbi:thioredoxin trx1 [Coemansia spiralis]|nr:thioredoxin trx1 [Coemansia spiralis]